MGMFFIIWWWTARNTLHHDKCTFPYLRWKWPFAYERPTETTGSLQCFRMSTFTTHNGRLDGPEGRKLRSEIFKDYLSQNHSSSGLHSLFCSSTSCSGSSAWKLQKKQTVSLFFTIHIWTKVNNYNNLSQLIKYYSMCHTVYFYPATC